MTRENLSLGVGEQQRSSLISVFFIHCLDYITSRLATSKIKIFKLVSIDEQAGLNITLSETLKTGFLSSRPKFHGCFRDCYV